MPGRPVPGIRLPLALPGNPTPGEIPVVGRRVPGIAGKVVGGILAPFPRPGSPTPGEIGVLGIPLPPNPGFFPNCVKNLLITPFVSPGAPTFERPAPRPLFPTPLNPLVNVAAGRNFSPGLGRVYVVGCTIGVSGDSTTPGSLVAP